MGNNPSKNPGDAPPHAGYSTHAASAPDKKVNRQSSLNALSGTAKAAAADPSASKETAKGHHSASQKAESVQKRLQHRNAPEPQAQVVDRPDRLDAKKPEARSREVPSADPSNPVQVPAARPAAGRDPHPSVPPPSGHPSSTYYHAPSHLQRPPRMPLPIVDATTTPGSPIIGPEDSHIGPLPTDRFLDDQRDQLASAFDSTTVDEEDAADELQPYTVSGVGKAIPTIIEWNAPGEKVYVTGTFVNWEKKFRLHRSDNGVMATTLDLRAGTHHMKFIVDGEMRASDSLPTAVDFTNHLVNYIEINPDDVNRLHKEAESRGTVPEGIRPPQIIPELAGTSQIESKVDSQAEAEEPEEIPLGDFRNIVPQFLADLDKEEESPAYQQAANVIGDTPTPPSLPLFLGKSILNGTTPMKDDSSVLNYPNHTVLNHLATSSIKNGVLATSVTTRYKRKYVTTILYKPTGDITE